MLLLEFSIAAHTYVLAAKSVIEVVPAVPLHPRSGLLPTLEYRGSAVPVLDLRYRYCGESTASSLATRIVLVGQNGQIPSLGLLAEHVTAVRVRALSPVDSAPAVTPIPTHCFRDEGGGVRYLVDLESLGAEADDTRDCTGQRGS